MIKIGDNVYRNLEEQVQKNKEDIANHYNRDRVLADFGIRVIGQVDTAEDIEDKVGEEFGDAYLVGTAEPYSFYVWTRANVNAGHPEDYWLDIGPIAIQGPEGPVGPIGPKGPRGSEFTSGSTLPMVFSGTLGDTFMIANDYGGAAGNGDVYVLESRVGYGWEWNRIGNLRGPEGPQGLQGPRGVAGETGPQGPQGPMGPEGPQGKFVTVRGSLPNAAQLPTPATINDLTAAYLIGTGDVKDLYIQIGETSQSAQWNNVGPFNIGSIVTVEGSFVSTFDADTKLDKDLTLLTDTVTGNIPVFTNSGTPAGSVKLAYDNQPYSIMLRDSNYRSFVGNPVLTSGASPYYVINRLYVDSHAGGSISYTILPNKMRDFRITCSGIQGTRTDVPAGFYEGTGTYTIVSSGDEVTVSITNSGGAVKTSWTGKYVTVTVSPATENPNHYRVSAMYYSGVYDLKHENFYIDYSIVGPEIKFQTTNSEAYLHYTQAAPFRLRPVSSAN